MEGPILQSQEVSELKRPDPRRLEAYSDPRAELVRIVTIPEVGVKPGEAAVQAEPPVDLVADLGADEDLSEVLGGQPGPNPVVAVVAPPIAEGVVGAKVHPRLDVGAIAVRGVRGPG